MIFRRVIICTLIIASIFITSVLIDAYNRVYTGIDIMCINIGLYLPFVIYLFIDKYKD